MKTAKRKTSYFLFILYLYDVPINKLFSRRSYIEIQTALDQVAGTPQLAGNPQLTTLLAQHGAKRTYRVPINLKTPQQVLEHLASLLRKEKKLFFIELYINNIDDELTDETAADLSNYDIIFLSLHNFIPQPLQLPDNFGLKLTNLRSLNLGSNKINQLPENFGQDMFNLRTLCLCLNNLRTLPERFGKNLENLYDLDLSQNQLEVLPECFENGLPKIKVLFLNSNKLNELTDGFVNNFQNANIVNISGNPIYGLDPSSYYYFRHGDNDLDTFNPPSNTFSHITYYANLNIFWLLYTLGIL